MYRETFTTSATEKSGNVAHVVGDNRRTKTSGHFDPTLWGLGENANQFCQHIQRVTN